MSEDEVGRIAYEYHMQNDFQNAKKYYKKFLTLNPEQPQVNNNLGVIYQIQGDLQRAKLFYEKALTCNPNYIDTLKNIASLYKIEGDLQSAKKYYHQIADLDEKDIAALNNLSVIYKLENDHQKAQKYATKVLKIDTNNADAYNNLGVIYKEKKDLVKALEYYTKALEIEPKSFETVLNLALLFLLQKEYEKGFELYRYRYHKYDLYINTELLKEKILIQNLADAGSHEVLICFEQGFGDAIQFIRFDSQLASLNMKYVYYISQPLLKLFTYNFPNRSFMVTQEIQEFLYYLPMLDMGYHVGLKYENIPLSKRYLHVDANDAIRFAQKHLNVGKKKKVGFAYQGSPLHQNDKNRSIELKTFLEGLCELFGEIKFYSLQYGISKEEKIVLDEYNVKDLGSLITDFYDTAVMVACMDAIVSIDSSLIHLSGAMGKKSFLMLPFVPDWRWGLDETETNWYTSVKIYRQEKISDWDSVLKMLKEDVKNEV